MANVHSLAHKHMVSSGREQWHKITHADVIWVNQQWTKVLILLMTKICLSL